MRSLQGQLGDAVVIMAGYDDWYDFDVAVDQIVAEAKRQNVGRVIWLTYRTQGPYVGVGGAYAATYRQFNAILAAKVRQHPELIVADWDTYSLGQSSWFSSDGIHISPTGAMALAQFIKAQLDAQDLHRCYGGTSGTPSSAPTPVGVTQTPPGLFTATNQRLLDTRADAGDGVNAPVAAGHVMRLPLVAQGKVPAGSTAVMVNLTAASSCRGGFVTAFPCGSQVPLASNLNVGTARTRAALATVMLNGQGELCVYSSQRTDLVVDLFGSFGPNGLAVNPISPDRYLDTRNAAGARNPRVGRIGPGTFGMKVAGIGPVPGNARAVLLNVTAVDPNADGFVTVHPCGSGALGVERQLQDRPDRRQPRRRRSRWLGAGVLHRQRGHAPGRRRGRLARRQRAAGPGPDARSGSWTRERARAGSSAPCRRAASPRSPSRATACSPRSRPSRRPASGFVTAYPCPNRPTASSLNYVAGDIVPNLVAIPPGAGGTGCIFTLSPSHIVVDRAATLVA